MSAMTGSNDGRGLLVETALGVLRAISETYARTVIVLLLIG